MTNLLNLVVSRKQMVDRPYQHGEEILEAIYSTGRLRPPFEGVLLVGY